jgi:IS1 family transposase
VKDFGEPVEQIKWPAAQIVELNEWHNCVRHKNYRCVWFAVDRLGQRFLHAITGTRDVMSEVRLWAAIQSSLIEQAMTDHWNPYTHAVHSVEPPVQSSENELLQ